MSDYRNLMEEVYREGQKSKAKQVNVTTTVHEHRAPTDESARLLKELEEKAWSQIIATIRLQSNTLTSAVVFMQANMYSVRYAVLLELNGTRFKAEHDLEEGERYRLTSNAQELAADLVAKHVAEILAKIIAQEIKKNLR